MNNELKAANRALYSTGEGGMAKQTSTVSESKPAHSGYSQLEKTAAQADSN